MRKITVLIVIGIFLVGIIAGCGSKEDKNKLVVYSPNSDGIINTVIPMFEKETGITVELISAGTGELFKRLESEKGNPYADAMFGGASAQYLDNSELFAEYTSKNAQYLLEGHDFDNGYMTANVADGSVLLVNTNLIGDIKIEGYEDLLNPELKGKISAADPASSSSAFAQLTNMLLAMGGDYTSDAGWDYVSELIKNLDGKVASGSGAAHKSVADGEYVVALTYEDPSADYVRSGAPVKIVYPKEGTVFLDAGAGVVKGANNENNAQKFMDFILSEEAQNALGTESTNRPLRKDAKLGEHMTPMEDIHTIVEDEVYVNEHKDEIIERYNDLFTDLQ